MTPKEILEVTTHIGLPKFSAREIALWIYKRGAQSFDDMTNISLQGRELLAQSYTVGLTPFSKENISADGTKKYLFPTAKNRYIETAYIPEKKRHTLCISSQTGCKLDCKFCMTGKQGYQGQLSVAEILNQVIALPEKKLITNFVFMGMGEPFDNTDSVLKALEILTSDFGLEINPRKITVSTVGLIPGMKRFLEKSQCSLAISLHSPFDREREILMPIQKKYPIEKVVETLKTYKFDRNRRLSFEYILFKDINDSQRHINNIARLLNGLKCRINLMRFHEIPGTSLRGTDEDALQNFKDRLQEKGLIATIRASRGEDIMAACGLLSTKELVQ